MLETSRERNTPKSFEDVPESDIDDAEMAANIAKSGRMVMQELAELGPVIGDREAGQPASEATSLHVDEVDPSERVTPIPVKDNSVGEQRVKVAS